MNTDDLNLETFNFDPGSVYCQDDVIRNLKDENGRLMKLLQEKDFEIKRLENKSKFHCTKSNLENDKNTLTESGATLKIIELSKRLREITAELEKYKTKYNEILSESKLVESKTKLKDSNKSKVTTLVDEKEILKLKDSIKLKEEKVGDLTVKLDKVTRDYQSAERLLRAEIGDDVVDIRKLIQDSTGWRGRAQKIISLQNQLEKLRNEIQFGDSNRSISSGASSLGWKEGKSNVDAMTKLRKERQQEKEKLETQNTQLQNEVTKLKRSCDGLRARNDTLNNDVTRLKKQIKDMLEKAENDDELVASLLRRQQQLQLALEKNEKTIKSEVMSDNVAISDQHNVAEIEKLKQIILEKEQIIRDINNSKSVECKNIDPFDSSWKDQSCSLENEITELRKLYSKEGQRCEDLVKKNIKIYEEMSQLKQDLLHMERELQKVSPSNKARKRLKAAIVPEYSQGTDDTTLTMLLSSDLPITKETVEMLQEAISLRTDKIESLTNGLELMSFSKKEDMEMMTQILDNTRVQFMESVKKMKEKDTKKSS